jgi:hypothetical protein
VSCTGLHYPRARHVLKVLCELRRWRVFFFCLVRAWLWGKSRTRFSLPIALALDEGLT